MFQTARVAIPRVGHIRRNVQRQLQSLFVRFDREGFDGGAELFPEREFECLQFKFARFHLGEVEDVVEQAQERIGRAFHRLEETTLCLGQRRVQRQVGHAHDGIHRGADFVAHIRQELALGLVGRFRGVLGLLQLFLRAEAFDGLRDGGRRRRQRVQCLRRKRAAREHAHDAVALFCHQQRITGEGDHALGPRPLPVADAWVVGHVVGHVRLLLLGDQPDLELADRSAAVRAVQVRVHSGAGLQLQGHAGFIEHPDPGERRVEARVHGSGAFLEHHRNALPPA